MERTLRRQDKGRRNSRKSPHLLANPMEYREQGGGFLRQRGRGPSAGDDRVGGAAVISRTPAAPRASAGGPSASWLREGGGSPQRVQSWTVKPSEGSAPHRGVSSFASLPAWPSPAERKGFERARRTSGLKPPARDATQPRASSRRARRARRAPRAPRPARAPPRGRRCGRAARRRRDRRVRRRRGRPRS